AGGGVGVTRGPWPGPDEVPATTSSGCLDVDLAGLVDAEDPQQPAEPEEGRDTDGEVEDLGVAEALPQPGEEVVADPGVVEHEALGVLDGQPLLLRVVVPVLVGDVAVEVLGESLLRHRRSPKVQSDGTVVELGDAHLGRLPDADRQDAVVVGGIAQPGLGPAHFWSQGSDLDGGAARAFGHVDAWDCSLS